MRAFGGVLALVCLISAATDAMAPSAPVVLRQALTYFAGSLRDGTISADGRFVAVVSMARLLPADVNSVHDIYVLDRKTHTLTLETVSPDGAASDGSSLDPHLSADGRYLVFDSAATNLTALPDRNDAQDVFVRDRLSGITRWVSAGPAGQANAKSGTPVISDDGRFVAFASAATNLVPGVDANGGANDIYLARLATGEITRVSVDSELRQLAVAFSPSLSADGGLVAFAARERVNSSEPRHGSTPARDAAVYVRDMTSETTTCISCDREDAAGLPAFAPAVSADGRAVVFAVQTEPERSDVAIHDRSTSVTRVITRRANARSARPRVSADGHIVVFESWASDLLCDRHCPVEDRDENVLPDIYLFDGHTGRFTRVSGSRTVWWAPSVGPAIDGAGRTVVFSSRQPYGPEDVTVDFDLFVCTPVCQ